MYIDSGRDESSEEYDQEELETAAENLMQHLSVEQLDMIHLRFMTGILPDDLPDPSDDEAGGSVIGNNAGGVADPVSKEIKVRRNMNTFKNQSKHSVSDY